MSLLRLLFICILLIFSGLTALRAQEPCDPPSDVSAYFLQPFGEELNVFWNQQAGETYRVSVGSSGFDPYLNEGDTIISTGNSGIYGLNLAAETHFDVYVQSICPSGDSSIWQGPMAVYRDPAPEACGYDVEHACDLEVTAENGAYFVVPYDMQDTWPLDQEIGCHSHSRAAWYTFTAPDNGSVTINAWRSSNYVTVFDESLNEIFCRLSSDSCIAGQVPPDSLYLDSIPLSLDPGATYYVATATVLFCDDTPDFGYWDTGFQVTSNSPEILCTEPTGFEVHFEYPFGEIAYGSWQGQSGDYEIYYGAPGFDPYASEGDSALTASAWGATGGFWYGNTFPADTHYDVYIRQLCDSINSDWVGPVDIYRPTPPDSCGYDMEHACELYPSTTCDDYFVIPVDYQDQQLGGASCHNLNQGGWYSFIMPETGVVQLNFPNGAFYYSLYDSSGEELECFRDTCIAGDGSSALSNDPPVFEGTAGEQYFITTAVNLFCDATANPMLYVSALCIEGTPDSLIIDTPLGMVFDCDEDIPPLDLAIVGGCPPYEINLSEELTSQLDCESQYTVTGSVIDNCGQEEFISFSYLVTDLTPPEVTCPDTDTLWTSGGMAAQLYDIDDAIISDNCNEVIDYIITPAPQEVLAPGSYTLSYAVSDICANTAVCTAELIVASPVGLEEQQLSGIETQLLQGQLSITSANFRGLLTIQIYDTSGRLIRDEQMGMTPFALDLTLLESGVYVLQVSNTDGLIYTEKLNLR